MPNPLRERIAVGRPTRALWLEAASPALAEAAVYAGFKFVLIDNEHGPASVEGTAHLLRAIRAAGGHPMVRVAANDPVALKRMLELGVETLMIPNIQSGEEARAAIAACRYPPLGNRGFAGEIRAARYGLDGDYAGRAADDLFVMLQIESTAGVDAAEEIAATDGVDMIFPGPYDLSGSLGVRAQTGHPDVLAAMDRLVAAAKAAGRPLGTVPYGPFGVRDLIEKGYALVIADSDIGHAIRAMKADADAMPADWLSLS